MEDSHTVDEFDEQAMSPIENTVSRRTLIYNQVLNPFLRRGVRAIEMVLDHHVDRGLDTAIEAERIGKHALLLMMTRYFDEEDIIVLADTSSLELPKKLAESSTFDIRAFLDGKENDPHVNDGDSAELKKGPDLQDFF